MGSSRNDIAVHVPLTDISIVWIYFAVQFSETIKLFAGIPMLKSGFWAKCVVSDISEKG